MWPRENALLPKLFRATRRTRSLMSAAKKPRKLLFLLLVCVAVWLHGIFEGTFLPGDCGALRSGRSCRVALFPPLPPQETLTEQDHDFLERSGDEFVFPEIRLLARFKSAKLSRCPAPNDGCGAGWPPPFLFPFITSRLLSPLPGFFS